MVVPLDLNYCHHTCVYMYIYCCCWYDCKQYTVNTVNENKCQLTQTDPLDAASRPTAHRASVITKLIREGSSVN